MASRQQTLPLEDQRYGHPYAEFSGIPGIPAGVSPVPFRTLKAGDSLLFVHVCDQLWDDLPRGKRRLFRSMLSYNGVDAPGTISILLIQKVAKNARHLTLLDRRGTETLGLMSVEQERTWIASWFHENRREP